jgi:hypothetical protein
MRVLILLAVLLGLAACYPAGNATRNGAACHSVGYGYRPYMIDPNGQVC